MLMLQMLLLPLLHLLPHMSVVQAQRQNFAFQRRDFPTKFPSRNLTLAYIRVASLRFLVPALDCTTLARAALHSAL